MNVDVLASMEASIKKLVASTVTEMMASSEDRDKYIIAVQDTLNTLESTVSDIVSALEDSGVPKSIADVVDAIKSMKTEVVVNVPEQPAPQITVNVEPTPVQFEAVMPTPPAPVIHLIEREEKQITYEVEFPDARGNPRTMTITRTVTGY